MKIYYKTRSNKKTIKEIRSIFDSTNQIYFRKKPGNGGKPANLIINIKTIKVEAPPNQLIINKLLLSFLKIKNKGQNIKV